MLKLIHRLTYKEDRVASSPKINKAEIYFYTVYPLSISHPWIPCQPEFIHLLLRSASINRDEEAETT